jgi:hypothetical protein
MIEVTYIEIESKEIIKIDNRKPLDDDAMFITIDEIDYLIDYTIEQFHISDLDKILSQNVYLKQIDL